MKSGWTVETLDARVDAELEALPVKLKAKMAALMNMIEERGLTAMQAPHVAPVEGKIWELRAFAGGQIARGLYVAVREKRVIVLHVFEKKTQKTPAKALRIAKERTRQIK
ncbi:type II toxin-antitoxin system RelE/ParE family toxin [Tepidicaulis sp. LMO-SS28]|uniref:type II toxin-antitoxin system RelE/ParE family toxin n=1 Tax=Tepidicaulis sp. LMO-SS28 TaxID=3447455 RepID=UPI003EE067D8